VGVVERSCGGGPIVTQTATAIIKAANMKAAGIGFSFSMMNCDQCDCTLPHLLQTCQAKLAIEDVDECRHDRTPLLDHGGTVHPACFRPSSPVGENGFVLSGYYFFAASPTKYVHGIATTRPRRSGVRAIDPNCLRSEKSPGRGDGVC
jgi:hypothetical protein